MKVVRLINWFHSIPIEVRWVFLGIFIFLGICSIIFAYLHRKNSNRLTKELIQRTNAWWKIAIGFFVIANSPPVLGTILVAYISYVALREMLSISPLRASDRIAFFLCYLALPVQYYLAHTNFYNGFIIFIPIIMILVIPSALVLSQNTNNISRSMSTIPAILLLTVFMPSHVIMMRHLEFDNFFNGPSGILTFVIILLAFSDVFQYAWGKLVGKRKILPNIASNKTWEGFILGIISTAAMAYGLKFLTPLRPEHAIGMGILIGVAEFLGDAILTSIKRDIKIRDTGDILNMQGGVMDRLNSVIISVPIYYHFMRYFAEIYSR